MTEAFPFRLMYWVGVDPVPGSGSSADAVRAAVAEAEGLEADALVVLELSQQDARGDIGAQYVAAYPIEGELNSFAIRQGERAAEWLGSGFVPRWRVVFERFLEQGTPEPAGSPVVLVAMTPAADATSEQVDDFNTFYNETHLFEVLRDWDWQRATRYELRRELLHPEPGCPRYLAIYERSANEREVPLSGQGQPNYSGGPYAWEARNTAWRLWYDHA